MIGLMHKRDHHVAGSHAQAGGLHERLAAVVEEVLLNELATALAHELNQPLAAITAYADGAVSLLRRSAGVSEEALGAVESIGREALRAGRGIHRARHELTPSAFRRVPFDCVAPLRELHAVLADLCAAGQVTPIVRLPAQPLHVRGDPLALQAAVLLLAREAVDAVRQLPRLTRSITISAHAEVDRVLVTVSHPSPAVEPARLPAPGPAARRRLELGLAGCATLALRLDGELLHHAERGGRNSMRLQMPAAPSG
jgi:C4-dicarboxylate-specific signal transduction histidine kinase